MFDKYLSKVILGASFALLPFMQLTNARAQRVARPDKLQIDDKIGLYDYTFSYSLNETRDSVDITFLYAMANKFLVFDLFKNGEAKNYKSFFMTNLTFKDPDGIIRKRIANSDSIVTSKIEATTDRKSIHNESISVRVPARDYSISIELTGKSGSRLNKFIHELKLDSMLKTPNVFCGINFITNPSEYCINRNMLYSAKPKSILIPLYSKNTNGDFKYRISALEADERETSLWNSIASNSQLEGNVIVHSNSVLDFSHSNAFINVDIKPTTSGNQSILQIDMGTQTLDPGHYKLEILSGNSSIHTFEFEVEWKNMPTALRTPKQAVDAMFYLLTDDEIKSISRGSDGEVARRVLDYWKKLDPTPENSYNEAMAQYFRRYDEAHTNYSNDANKQGEKTDRGMIYVLYGSPDEIKTELKNDKSFEIWNYNKLKKEFSFEKIKMDTYKLSAIKE